MRKWWAWVGIILATGTGAGRRPCRISRRHDQDRRAQRSIGPLCRYRGYRLGLGRAQSGRGFRRCRQGHEGRILSGDHQNKPDIGLSIARQWFDVDKVDAIADVPTSSVALAVNEVVRDKNKVFLAVGPATSDLTGKACSPNTVHWIYDTWALANGTGNAIVKRGGDTGSSSPPITPSAMRSSATPKRSCSKAAARCSARSVTRSPAPTSPRSCSRRRHRSQDHRARERRRRHHQLHQAGL